MAVVHDQPGMYDFLTDYCSGGLSGGRLTHSVAVWAGPGHGWALSLSHFNPTRPARRPPSAPQRATPSATTTASPPWCWPPTWGGRRCCSTSTTGGARPSTPLGRWVGGLHTQAASLHLTGLQGHIVCQALGQYFHWHTHHPTPNPPTSPPPGHVLLPGAARDRHGPGRGPLRPQRAGGDPAQGENFTAFVACQELTVTWKRFLSSRQRQVTTPPVSNSKQFISSQIKTRATSTCWRSRSSARCCATSGRHLRGRRCVGCAHAWGGASMSLLPSILRSLAQRSESTAPTQ
jgi:hypothetical protein